MTPSSHHPEVETGLRGVDISGQLARRRRRDPDYRAEARAMGALAAELAANPRNVLQRLGDLAVELCHADAAGVGTLATQGEHATIRWHAIAGDSAELSRLTAERDAIPIDAVVARDAVMLVGHDAPSSRGRGAARSCVRESLVAPWRVEGRSVGILCAFRRTPGARFDAEDARLLGSLAAFARAGWQSLATLDAAAAGEERQALLLELSDALRSLDDPAEIERETCRLLERFFASPGGSGDAADGERGVAFHAVAQRSVRSSLGQAYVVPDVESSAELSPEMRETYLVLGIRSLVAVPLVSNGELVWTLGATSATAREWPVAEVSLIREAGERMWQAIERSRAEAALRDRDERFRMIVDEATDYAIFSTNVEQRIETWSPGAEAVFGWTPEEAIGKSFDMTFTPEDQAAGEPGREVAGARDNGSAPDVRWHRRKDGRVIFIEGTAYGIRGANGAFRGLFKIGRDSTARRRAEAALQRSEAKFRAVAHLVPDLLWQGAPDGSAEWHNDRWFGYTGQTEAEAAGWGWAEVIHPDDRERALAMLTRALERGEQLQQEQRIRAADGSYRWFLMRAEPLRDATGHIVQWFGAATDVHDERMARDELTQRVADATAGQRRLSQRLLEVQEDERRHLARELHDEIGQMLTGLGFQLGSAGQGADPRLAEARRMVSELTEQVRQLSMDLRPAVLDAYGLLPAARWHIERYQTRTGVRVDFRHEGLDRRFAPAVEITAYRILQEALTNIARHAGARVASLRMLADKAMLTVAIRDDGQGFDPAAVSAASGLGGMRERVDLLGGTLTIDAAPGAGTLITVDLPLERSTSPT